ncbi:MAG TPA: SusC/RagA family TonB-linked outer membrane protein, partial [Sunxiuqinia sp.]|nr:SusC/RagA family TonB-linked outer membrane protein [Sunxiuqinia sp.]
MKIIRKKLKILLMILGLLVTQFTFAQEISLSGKITDSDTGDPIPGATVVVKGTTNGTVSDFDGNYTLKVEKGDTLQFSYIGYKKSELVVSDQTTLNMALRVDTEELGEVVVIGYGQVKKSDATGSVVAVDSKDFNKGAITSPQDLLVGKSAGVVITNAGGAPGAGATIRIRGGSSLNASNDPLIIVDGVPLDNNTIGGGSNLLSFINPNDIATFTVLKDASATAIYGSRASNGVILITTKKGKAGSPMTINYGVKTSVASPVEYVDVFSGDEMRLLAWQYSQTDHGKLFNPEYFGLLGSENTNWQKEIFRNAFTHDHNLSISGAVKSLPYRVSIGYVDQDGILKNTGLKRWTGAISLNPTLLNGDLKLNMNAKGMRTKNNFGDTGAIGSAVNMDPTQPVMDGNPASAGYYQWQNYGASLGTPNPVEQALAVDNKSTVQRVIANVQADYKLPFLPDLHANLNLATDYTDSKGHNNRPVTSPTNLTDPTVGKTSSYTGTNYNNLLDFYLNYKKDIKEIKSSVDVTAGYSWQHFKREKNDYRMGVSDSIKPDATENYLVSFFGRINYTFNEKYLLTFTMRDDGSSRFIGNNQWGLFPSAAFAWKIKQEPFLKNVKAITEMKLRLGWGITGQQNIGQDYPAQAKYVASVDGSYYQIGGKYIPTLRPDAYDPNIKWEQTTTQNVGLDFGFADNRITGSLDVYKRITDNLLNDVTIPSGSNFSNTLLTNVGSLENKGAEFSLNLVPISKKDMSLNVGFNLTYNKNKITKLLLNDDPNYIGILYGDGMTGYKQVTRVGQPAYSFFLNKQVYDSNGNPIEG